jgi:hypothetical protein
MTATAAKLNPIKPSIDTPYPVLRCRTPNRCVGIARVRRAHSCFQPWFGFVGAEAVVVRLERPSGTWLPVSRAARGGSI